MMVPPLRTRLVSAALAIMAGTAFLLWAFVLPDDPLTAVADAVVAGGSAAAALLPFMLS